MRLKAVCSDRVGSPCRGNHREAPDLDRGSAGGPGDRPALLPHRDDLGGRGPGGRPLGAVADRGDPQPHQPLRADLRRRHAAAVRAPDRRSRGHPDRRQDPRPPHRRPLLRHPRRPRGGVEPPARPHLARGAGEDPRPQGDGGDAPRRADDAGQRPRQGRPADDRPRRHRRRRARHPRRADAPRLQRGSPSRAGPRRALPAPVQDGADAPGGGRDRPLPRRPRRRPRRARLPPGGDRRPHPPARSLLRPDWRQRLAACEHS